MAHIESDKPPQAIKISLDITYELKGNLDITDAMEAATDLVTKAREFGAATGFLVIGRQKFPLK